MTREEARKKAEIMLAYADGKEIEFWDRLESEWVSIDEPAFDLHIDCYRIKRETKYRPFKDGDECFKEMKKHEPFGWVMSRYHEAYNIWQVDNTAVRIYDGFFSYECALQDYIFADGMPFGIKEEES